ncbi:aconitate hydratase [Egicoccus halophilus]|uniref:Aconitate hydratase n=1 Tax=Egicoccus halophilus TaxID=1670830 RepID=A0A8J3ACH4_9ACTN|nr:aconitate hydratase [Egicoccus halophilus]GGI04283.1 aconitate hydratase [Egicoccus halophilus]
MGENVARKVIADHLVEGEMTPGTPIGLRIDQTLTQDATGTLVMLELEAMGLDRVRTEVSVQYVDHNLIQEDHKNPDDHLFLRSAAARFGLWYSKPGNGISHPVHQERFGRPGATMAGSDSHTPAAGALGMLAIGSGGLDVAMAMAGEPLRLRMPRIWGIELVGELPDWVSAKDVILELLRRHGVDGGSGRILEYHGEGLAGLSSMDRHVICNMGAELGATTSIFPADDEVRRFLRSQGREDDFTELVADADASYDDTERIDLSELVPLIARPSSPGDVVPVSEVAGAPIAQAYLGSSANPGYRDFAVAAEIVAAVGEPVSDQVSFDVNPSSRQILGNLIRDGHLLSLVTAGARIHQAGCNGCIGMGQAPATEEISLRTTPRNFPGRSGTREDKVFLCSPETATASAITGVITDPRDLAETHGITYPRVAEPTELLIDTGNLVAPLPPDEGGHVALRKGPNIATLPDVDPLPDDLELPVVLKMGDDVSTDEILRAGAEVLPYRSNIPEIARFAFDRIDETYHDRAMEWRDGDGHAVVGGRNYGQGSSREHAALAPRHLGLRVALVKEFARIHAQNLANFGVVPLRFVDEDDWNAIEQDDVLRFTGLRDALRAGAAVEVVNVTRGTTLQARHELSPTQVERVLSGGVIRFMKQRLDNAEVDAADRPV